MRVPYCPKPVRVVFFVASVIALWLLSQGRLVMGTATISYGIMLWGVSLRRINTPDHARLGLTSIALDLIVVGILEFDRGVVGIAGANELNAWQNAHVIVSSIATVLYIPVIILGLKLLKKMGTPRMRTWHIRFALTALATRTIGFILMFSMLSRPLD